MSIKQNLTSILAEIYDYVNISNTNDTLIVDGFDFDDDECLYINKRQKELYCIQLLGAGNTATYISDTKVNTIFEEYNKENNSYIIEAKLKKKFYQKSFIFSNNKDLLELIAKDLDVKFVKSLEMLNVLNDLFLGNDYFVKDKKLYREVDLSEKIKYENMAQSFNNMVKENVYNNFTDIDVYQAYRFRDNSKPVNLTALFKLDWYGVIWTFTSFSSNTVMSVLEDRKWQGKYSGESKDFERLIESYKNSELNLAVRNSMVFLKKGNRTVISEIGNHLNTNYRLRPIFKKKLLQFTPIKYRDTNWDMIIDKDFFKKSIVVVHKEDTPKPNFYGKDINGSHITYNFSQTSGTRLNKNSDFLVMGVKGSGKTTTTNGIVSQTVGYRLGEEVAKELDTEHFRIFDIKYSGFKLAKELKEIHPKDVVIMDASLDKFKYNIVNITYWYESNRLVVDENELAMNILLLSIALESKSKNSEAGLSISEQTIFRDTVREVYEKGLIGIYIKELRDTHEEIYDEVMQLGFDDLDRTIDLPDDYNFLKVPTLDIIINQVSLKTEDNSDIVKQADSKTLYSKLRDLDSMGIFSGYDQFNIDRAKYLYMDFDKIKGVPEFIPIFLSIFNKLFTIDKNSQRELERQGLERPYITYLFEEAVNITTQESFELYLEKFINEARSDRIKAGFVFQLVSQVPNYMLKQIENKFVLFPAKNKRASLIDELSEKTKPDADTLDLLHKTPEFGVALWNEHGTSVFNLDLTKEEIAYYGQAQ